MGHAKLIKEAFHALGFLKRIQIFALYVFDQRHGDGGTVVGLAHQRPDPGQPGQLRRPPAPFASDDFVTFAVAADDDRLDQALGTSAEPVDPLRPEDMIEARRSFAEPIAAAETIARYIGKLVATLCEALETRGLGARRLDLLCHRVDNCVETVRIGLARPVRDPQRLTRLLCDKIETIDPA